MMIQSIIFSGIDNQMWEAAKIDNPNPKKYMPIAINGFTDLKNRMHNQEYETGLHKAFLQKVDKDISELRKKHASSIAQITDLKQKFLQLQHRILRVIYLLIFLLQLEARFISNSNFSFRFW